jgi:Lipase (class 2)
VSENRRFRAGWITLQLVLGLATSAVFVKTASATGSMTIEATFTSVANGWVKVERIKDNDTNFPTENYPPDGRGNQDGQRLTFFGNVTQPASSRFLLFYAPGWNTNSQAAPVILVHGANDNVDRAWANPNDSGGFGCGASTCPTTGLMQVLSNNGLKVFAINFAHKQGDNLLQAQLLYDAIQRVKAVTGATQVDVVGWSKGAFLSRMYVSSVKPSWGVSYAGDVRRLVLIGNPNAGYDYPFRHGWSHDFSIFTECGASVNAPSPHTAMTCFGNLDKHPELSIYTTSAGNFYPGQKQLLARFDNTFPLPTNEQDWQTTYYGGNGFFTQGLGIQAAINQGSLVATIRAAGIPSSVTVFLLAGGANTIPTIHDEHTGPSDGVVFIESATDSTGIPTLGGTTIVAGDNHLELGWEATANSQVLSWLKQ